MPPFAIQVFEILRGRTPGPPFRSCLASLGGSPFVPPELLSGLTCMGTLSKAPITPGLRRGYDLPATEKCWNRGQIVERTYDWSRRSHDWSQRSWVIARAKSVVARSWSCSNPSHTGLTTRIRPTCDRKMLQSWANRRKNVRLVAEVVRLVAEVGCDRKGQISLNKVDGHVQNL